MSKHEYERVIANFTSVPNFSSLTKYISDSEQVETRQHPYMPLRNYSRRYRQTFMLSCDMDVGYG